MDDNRKRGRPKKNDARKIACSAKISNREQDRLIFLMEELNMSSSEVLRYALNECYEKHS